MKHALVVVVLCLTISVAWAQSGFGTGRAFSTARAMGMGDAVVGVANDAAAWYQNPAGLGLMKSTNSMIPLASDVVGTWASKDLGSQSAKERSITWSGSMTGRGLGLGLGYGDVEDSSKTYGAGFGMALKPGWLSWGLNVLRYDPQELATAAVTSAATTTTTNKQDADTRVSAGLMLQIPQLQSDPIRVGVTVQDIFDGSDHGPFVNAGAYWPVIKSLGFALDLRDITDRSEEGPLVNAGVEYQVGLLGNWTVRAGMVDDGSNRDYTAGVGIHLLKWRADAAYSAANDGMWALSGGWEF